VLGVLPGLLGIIQATEVIKLICKIGEPLIGRMLLVDALTMKFQELRLKRDPACPLCGANRTIHELIDYDQFCGVRGEPTAMTGDIQPEELKRRLDAGEMLFILDVREPHEYQIANLGGHLIPLNDLPKRLNELDPNREIITHCKMGGRSSQAVDFLRQQGFKNVRNLTGGINAWSEKVDPKIPKY
jgi:adenylyltransferase/sulfurtransferase